MMLAILFASLYITFREAFEAVLLMAILISYLNRTKQNHLVKPALLAGLLGTIVSIIIGIVFYLLYISIDPDLAEAVASFIAVPVVTSVVYWMAAKGKEIVAKGIIKAMRGGAISIALTAFIFVAREGFETVLLISPTMFHDTISTSIGVLLGLGMALAIGGLWYRGTLKLNLKLFFFITSILLVLIAGSILGYGVHEFIEYLEKKGHELGIWKVYVYRLPIDKDNILHDKSIVGAILAVMFGYATKMELIRAVIQIPYQVAGIILLWIIYFKGQKKS